MKKVTWLPVFLLFALLLVFGCNPDAGLDEPGPTAKPTPVQTAEPTAKPTPFTPQVGSVWISPAVIDVAVNKDFSFNVLVDSGTFSIASFDVTLTYDGTVFSVESVETGADGMSTVIPNINGNKAVIAGFDTGGLQAKSDLHLLTINCKALSTATDSVIDFNVGTLIDSNYNTIGIAKGTGAVISVQ